MTPWDVLVVGGGPAGSVAATVLARAGARVRLLDRVRFPRPKLCGDTVNPGTLALLQRLDDESGRPGVYTRLRNRGLPISGMTVSGPGDAVVAADYPDGCNGLSISRRELDLLLVEQAAAAGVDIAEGVRAMSPVVSGDRVTGVCVQTSAMENWDARLVIVADGRGSRIASSLQLSGFACSPRRWAYGAYFSGVMSTGARGEMHLRRNGYIGISALPDGLTNVCVVLPAAAGRVDQRMVIAEAIQADRQLRARFHAARQESSLLVLGPLAIDARASGCPGALLAGDAAGFVDPMTGDGLRFAVGGGRLAAEAALSELATGQPAYDRLHRVRQQAFAAKWRFNRALRMLAGSPRALTLAAWLSEWWDAPVQQLVRIAGDVRHAVPPIADETAAIRTQSRAW